MTIGLVVPCYNEAGRWNPAYWADLLHVPGVEFLFVDDGSTDDTRVLAESAVTSTTSRVLSLAQNAGKAEAVRTGMLDFLDRGEIDAVGYLDADGAFNRQDIEDLTSAFAMKVQSGDFDAAWSSRVALAGRDIARSGSRHYIGRLVATFVSLGYGQIPYDTQSGYKLFEPSAHLAACLSIPFRTRWLFELELLARWQRITGRHMRIWEVPLQYWHDVPGSKITGKETRRILRELLIVKQEQRRAV